jgi:hypothetical protein
MPPFSANRSSWVLPSQPMYRLGQVYHFPHMPVRQGRTPLAVLPLGRAPTHHPRERHATFPCSSGFQWAGRVVPFPVRSTNRRFGLPSPIAELCNYTNEELGCHRSETRDAAAPMLAGSCPVSC